MIEFESSIPPSPYDYLDEIEDRAERRIVALDALTAIIGRLPPPGKKIVTSDLNLAQLASHAGFLVDFNGNDLK